MKEKEEAKLRFRYQERWRWWKWENWKKVEASIWWQNRKTSFALWNWYIPAVGSKRSWIFLLNCYCEIKHVSPLQEKKKRKSSKGSIKNFWWSCSWNGGQLPRPCGMVVPLSGSLLLCCDFLTPQFPLGCQAASCSLWDRVLMRWRNDYTILKLWEFSGWL